MTVADIVGWSGVTPSIVNCGRGNQFGGYSRKTASKIYIIDRPYYQINVAFYLNMIRSWDVGENFIFKINNQKVLDITLEDVAGMPSYGINNTSMIPPPSHSIFQYTPCPDPVSTAWWWRDFSFHTPVSFNIQESSPSITLEIKDNLGEPVSNEAWSISNLFIDLNSCHESCKTCNGPLETDCLSCALDSTQTGNSCECNDFKFSHIGQCVTTCPVGWSPNNLKRICIQCPSNCQTCIENGKCTQCEAGFLLEEYENICLESCPFYMTVDGQKCRNPAFENQNKQVVYQGLSKNYFSSGEVKYDGWVLENERSQTHDGTIYTHTSYAANECGGISIAGGFGQYWKYTQSQYSMTKTLQNLPSHHGVEINIQFWAGDNWDNEAFEIQVDGNQVLTQTHSYTASTRDIICGSGQGNQNTNDIKYSLNIPSVIHTGSTLELKVQWVLSQNSYNEWGGFREIQISILKCLNKYGTCNSATECLTCNRSRTNQPQCDQPAPGYYDDLSGDDILPKCAHQCLECSGTPDNCTKCRNLEDSQYLPNCKPSNCFNYLQVESAATSHGDLFKITQNNIEQTITTTKGINLYKIDKTNGNILETKNFNTSDDFSQNSLLISYIDSLALGELIISGIKGDGFKSLNSLSIEKLKEIGWHSTEEFKLQDSYAVIGIKASGSVPQQSYMHVTNSESYSAKVEKCIIECDFKCNGCSTSPSQCTNCSSVDRQSSPQCTKPETCSKFIYIQSTGIENDPISTNSDHIKFKINDIDISTSQSRGVHIIVLDETEQIFGQEIYDYSSNTTNISAMTTFISNIATGRKVLLGSHTDMGKNIDSTIYTALQSLGLPSSVTIAENETFVMSGEKGTTDTAIYKKGTQRVQIEIQDCIIDCDSTTCVSSCTDNRLNCDQCKDSYLKVGNQCLSCTFPCQNCSGSQTSCDSCQGLNRKNDNTCDCVDEYYQNSSNICTPCEFPCLNCSDSTTCIGTCDGQADRRTAPTCACNLGYYEESTPQKLCIECPHPFTKCSDSSTPTECKSGTGRLDTGDNCRCDQGHFELTPVENNCGICEDKCLNCSNTPQNCDTCKYSDPNLLSAPDCICKEGWIETISNTCEKCSPGCKSCSGTKSNCNSCIEGYYKQGSQCIKCVSPCIRCTSQNSCQVCSLRYTLNEQSEQCEPCHPKCEICSPNNKNQCLLCKKAAIGRKQEINCDCEDGYYENGQNLNCIQCQTDNCQKCNSQGICIKCQNNDLLAPDCTHLIKGNLPFLSINSDGSTETIYGKCSIKCEKCNENADQCESCRYGLNRKQMPTCACQDGYHDNNGFSENCVHCSPLCKKCISENICIECEENINVEWNKFSKTCECQKGFKFQDSSRQCEKCYMFEQKCLFSCPSGTFADENLHICTNVKYNLQENMLYIYVCMFIIIALIILSQVYYRVSKSLNYGMLKQDLNQQKINNKNNNQEN